MLSGFVFYFRLTFLRIGLGLLEMYILLQHHCGLLYLRDSWGKQRLLSMRKVLKTFKWPSNQGLVSCFKALKSWILNSMVREEMRLTSEVRLLQGLRFLLDLHLFCICNAYLLSHRHCSCSRLYQVAQHSSTCTGENRHFRYQSKTERLIIPESLPPLPVFVSSFGNASIWLPHA